MLNFYLIVGVTIITLLMAFIAQLALKKELKKLQEPLNHVCGNCIAKETETVKLKRSYIALYQASTENYEIVLLDLRAKQKDYEQHSSDILQQVSSLLVPIATLMPIISLYSIEMTKMEEPTESIEKQIVLFKFFNDFTLFLVGIVILLGFAFTFQTQKNIYRKRILSKVNLHLFIAEEVLRKEKDKEIKNLHPFVIQYPIQ